MDEREGPYKVISQFGLNMRGVFSIAVESSNYTRGRYLKVIAPDVGEAQTARQICNLLNKNWLENRDTENEVIVGDEADRVDGSGIPDSDQ